MFLSEEGPTLETLDFNLLSASVVHQPFYISICITLDNEKTG